MRHWHHGRKESIFYENNRHKVFMTHSFGRQLCFCCLIFLSFGVFYFLSLVWRLFAHFSWYNFVLDTSYIPIQLVFPYSKPTNAVQGYPTNMRFFNVNINIQYIWIHIYIYTPTSPVPRPGVSPVRSAIAPPSPRWRVVPVAGDGLCSYRPWWSTGCRGMMWLGGSAAWWLTSTRYGPTDSFI